nr:hypothetical protein [Tanacetum cinerariifolium]
MLIEHMYTQGQGVIISQAWRRLFEIRCPLVHELILEFFSTLRFREAVHDLDVAGALQFRLGGVRWRMSWREFILGMGLHTVEEIESVGFDAYRAESARQILVKGDLSAYWVGISYVGDFLGIIPFNTLIRNSRLRLCYRLISCSIVGRSQTTKKLTMTDLFYLRGMDVGFVNIPYLLARLAKRHAFWSLNEVIEDYCSDIHYAVSIKKDVAYLCLHFTTDHKGTRFNTPYPE